MRKVFIAVSLLGIALLAAAGTASAVTISPGGAIQAYSDAALTFSGPLGITTACDYEFHGTFSTSARVGDTLGTITSGFMMNCVNRSTLYFPQPWEIVLDQVLVDGRGGVTDLLVTLKDFDYSETLLGVTCRYAGELPLRISSGTGAGNTITIPRTTQWAAGPGTGICGVKGPIGGQTLTLEPEQTFTP